MPDDLASVQAVFASHGILASWTYLGQPVDPRSVRRVGEAYEVLVIDPATRARTWQGVEAGELIRTIREA